VKHHILTVDGKVVLCNPCFTSASLWKRHS